MVTRQDMVGLQIDLDSLVESDQGRSCAITRNRLLGLLPQEIAADLIASSKTVILEKGQLLMRSGEVIEYVYFPHGGIASLIAELPDGRGIEVASIGMEGALGVARAFFPVLAFCTVVVQVPGLASRVSAQKLATIVDENKSVRNFFGTLMAWCSRQSSKTWFSARAFTTFKGGSAAFCCKHVIT